MAHKTLTMDSLLIEKDQECIWHPFTQAQGSQPPIPIAQGKGVYLYSQAGAVIWMAFLLGGSICMATLIHTLCKNQRSS